MSEEKCRNLEDALEILRKGVLEVEQAKQTGKVQCRNGHRLEPPLRRDHRGFVYCPECKSNRLAPKQRPWWKRITGLK